MAEVEVAMDSSSKTGESPVSYASGALRFVDIEGCLVHGYDTVARRAVGHLSTDGRMVGNVVPCASPSLPDFDLLACLETSVVPVSFYGNEVGSKHVAMISSGDVDAAKPIRWNDGKVDPRGRLWAGTMAMDPDQNPESGRLYCLQKSGNGYDLEEKMSPVGISNGTEWDGRLMYYIDSKQPEVSVFDFDPEDGSISNRRRVISIPNTQGLPDGMTIDGSGKLWVALHGGSSIVQIDPETQTELMTIKVPALCPTSVCFGGKDLSELYVTSSAQGEEGKGGNSEHRGALFRVHIPGVKGREFSKAFTQ